MAKDNNGEERVEVLHDILYKECEICQPAPGQLGTECPSPCYGESCMQ